MRSRRVVWALLSVLLAAPAGFAGTPWPSIDTARELAPADWSEEQQRLLDAFTAWGRFDEVGQVRLPFSSYAVLWAPQLARASSYVRAERYFMSDEEREAEWARDLASWATRVIVLIVLEGARMDDVDLRSGRTWDRYVLRTSDGHTVRGTLADSEVRADGRHAPWRGTHTLAFDRTLPDTRRLFDYPLDWLRLYLIGPTSRVYYEWRWAGEEKASP